MELCCMVIAGKKLILMGCRGFLLCQMEPSTPQAQQKCSFGRADDDPGPINASASSGATSAISSSIPDAHIRLQHHFNRIQYHLLSCHSHQPNEPSKGRSHSLYTSVFWSYPQPYIICHAIVLDSACAHRLIGRSCPPTP
jgi:hypothetical protein